MNIIAPHSHRSLPRQGLALVMTIIILALVTLMVLGFADLVRNETVASSAHLERARAQHMAQMAVDMVTGTLREHTADPDKVWASQPGSLIVPAADATDSGKKILSREIALHSGLPSNAAPNEDGQQPGSSRPAVFAPANLNVQMISDKDTHLITDMRGTAADGSLQGALELPVRWVYLRENGELDAAEEPTLGQAGNPIVGRFAWWTDDESSKINLNTAWKRNPTSGGSGMVNPFGPSHVSSLNLPNLITGLDFQSSGVPDDVAILMQQKALAMADTLHLRVSPQTPFDYTVVNRFFNSTYELRSLSNAAEGLRREHFAALHKAAKFQITHYNHDPDTTFFNEPRIVLTTLEEKANGAPFIDIKKKTAGEIWDRNHLDPEKLADTIEMLNQYLRRTDWPMAPGSSFQQRYYNNKPERLTQLSLNIIEYVRCKESAGQPGFGTIIPIRGTQNAGQRFVLALGNNYVRDANAYFGLSRSPRITEMGLWVSNSGSVKFKVEVHLPKNYGLDQIDLSKAYLYFSSGLGGGSETLITPQEMRVYHEGETPQQSTLLKAGGYAVITRSGSIQKINSNQERPASTWLRYAISSSKTDRWDVTPFVENAPYRLDPESVEADAISSLEVDDPCANAHPGNWIQRQEGNTFGAPNSIRSPGKTPAEANLTMEPQVDTDRNGLITDYSFYMPPPAEKYGETLVQSVGELGFIHTGVESAMSAGVPWRTLRLQPSDEPATAVPDWAFMDLFTVPVNLPETASPRAMHMFGPHGGTAGRINLNAQAQPYGNPAYVSTTLERHLPFLALLTGIPYSSTGDVAHLDSAVTTAMARDISRNIYHRTLAAKGKRYGHASVFDSPGEVVEIKGVADGGEESEEIVRGMSNLLCIRGGVFTVYAVGQALRETRNRNGLVVTGEFRQQTLLERYTEAAHPNEVRIRRLSFQPIMP